MLLAYRETSFFARHVAEVVFLIEGADFRQFILQLMSRRKFRWTGIFETEGLAKVRKGTADVRALWVRNSRPFRRQRTRQRSRWRIRWLTAGYGRSAQ